MSSNVRLAPLFGTSIHPAAGELQQALERAHLADELGLDLVTMMDHPYNPAFVETWTLLTAVGMGTQHVRLVPDVMNLALRPPAVLAKAAATLDLLTGGRVELGLGTGGLGEAIVGYGGPSRTPGEAVEAFEEGIRVIRAVWQTPDPEHKVSLNGRHYRLVNAEPGPAPAHSIGIWVGAYRPRMLRLIGRLADGWIPSAYYAPPEEIPAMSAMIGASAREAGRDPNTIRRLYNIGGVIVPSGQTNIRPNRRGAIVGDTRHWVQELVRYYEELGLNAFNFWPASENGAEQVRLYAQEIAPAVREAVARSG